MFKVKSIIKNLLKKSKLVARIYRKINHIPEEASEDSKKIGNYPIYQITSITPRPIKIKESMRINIIIPTLRADMVFGGISTALKFFDNFSDKRIAKRIIVTDTLLKPIDLEKYPDYELVTMEGHSDSKYQALSILDRINETLEVSENDVFISTAWWPAYIIEPVIKWQHQYYKKSMKPLIYFIQDYEPFFNPWSSKYCYAESTYHLEIPTIAIFNSKELKDYFNSNNYNFYKEFYFGPILNERLKKYLNALKPVPRKKKIIVYGRPGVARNAFEIIVDSLTLAFNEREDINDWEFISVGQKHGDVEFIKGKKLISIGKLNLEEYANLMNESYLGISLMISPHPSYPPLEMSTFGVKTITNNYANKDISYFNKNIISVKQCNPHSIAKEINRLCDKYTEESSIYLNDEYLNSGNKFKEIVKEINKIIK